jgi:hypothetical protein
MSHKSLDDHKPVTQKALMNTLIDFWTDIAYPMIDEKANKIDVTHAIDKLSTDVKDIKRRLIDIELDTPTKSEFHRLEKRVS